MISTFDLTLLGSLVSIGGLVFLRQGKWPPLRMHSLGIGKRLELSAERRDHLARSTAIAGARWLTVGALTLFVAYGHGAEEGYLFSPWTDALFHIVFVSVCWARDGLSNETGSGTGPHEQPRQRFTGSSRKLTR